MNIVVIGLGSMGKRRIRLIQQMFPDYRIVGVDGRADRREEASKLFDINCSENLDDVDLKIDCAFICTSPISHGGLIKKCLENRWNVFSEINLVSDEYHNNIQLAERNGCKLFLSSTFLYREEIMKIKEMVNSSSKWNYIYHVGQYLPDWHPWESYQNFFVGDKKTNGCREILAIELPWILDVFGDVKDIRATSDKISMLNISYDDNFFLQINHMNGNKGAIVVDVVSPIAVRKLEIYSENAYISWNGTPDSLMVMNDNREFEHIRFDEIMEHQKGYQSFIVENAYKEEIKDFFRMVDGKSNGRHSFEKDLNVIDLINKVGA